MLSGQCEPVRIAPPASKEESQPILGLIEATPDITLAEIAAHLDKRHGFKTAPSTIWRLLDRRGLTYKKNRARQRAAAR